MFKSFWNEIKYLFRNKWNSAAVILIVLFPFFFTFLQVSANWDPFGNSKNVQIAIVNLDGDNIFAKQTIKGIIKTDNELKFNGTNQKYNLNVNEIYLKDQSDVQKSLNTGKYDAIYVIPKGYENNLIDGPSNIMNNKMKKLSDDLKLPGYLKKNPYVEKLIFNSLGNFIQNMETQIAKGTPLTSNQKALFSLLNFFIRNSRVNVNALKKFTDAGIPESDLQTIDTSLTKITGLSNDNQPISILDLTKFIMNIAPANTFLSRVNYTNLMQPLLNGILSSLLSTQNKINFSNNTEQSGDNSKKIQFYLSNQNNAISSQLTNMLTHSPNLFSNIYTQDVLTQLSTDITNNIRPELRKLITQMLSNANNFINGQLDGVMEILYPGKGILDENKIIKNLVNKLFSPLKNLTFLWPYFDNSLADALKHNIPFLTFNVNGLITFKPIGNSNRKFGDIIAPNLIAISMWLAILGFVFISRNKRVKGNTKIGTIQLYFSKLLLYVVVGITQSAMMLVPLILYGVTTGHLIGFLLLFGLIASIIISSIAEAVSFLSKSRMSIILCVFLLLSVLTVAYGLFPLSLESEWIRWINYLSPTKYIIDGLNSLLNGYSLKDIFQPLLYLLLFTIIIPISLMVNIIYDKQNLKTFGKYKDFANKSIIED